MTNHRFAFGNKIALTVDLVNIEATCASGCSPVRLTPAVGVTTGAHYRMSTGHSSPALTHEVRGAPIKRDIQNVLTES